jgi:hypothetical protein
MPKGSRKIEFSFEERHLTHFGGMWLIQRFCSQLRLRYLLQKYVSVPQRAGEYHSSEMFLALLYAIIMGLRRIHKTDILQYNGAFLEMLGLDRFPDQSTLRRFLKRLPPQSIRRMAILHDSLRAHLFTLPAERHSLTFDIDSVVIVIYGKAEKAVVGYNPKKPGRRSYHPIFCFEAHLQEFWHGMLRPGNAASSTGIIPFLKVCLAKAPQKIGRSRIRFRMDAGFYSRHVVKFLEESGCGYVIVAKEHGPVKSAMVRTKFHALNNGWEVGEFRYQPQKWNATHRFIVVRRPIPEDPQEAKQLTLFKDRKYAYHVLVTNLTTTAWRTYLFYNGRAATEKNNRELLYDYPLGKIPTQSWTANVAFFQLLLFAANIVHWFKRIALPKEYRVATLDTIRTDFLVLPAKLVRASKKNIVRLPCDYHYRKEFLAAFQTIERLRIREKFRFCSQGKRPLRGNNPKK